jgi:uncharacterized membrane protein
MSRYKARLTRDLDAWIGRGLVPASSRDAILDSVPQRRRLEAATALAVVGALLLGVAIIAFIAANWGGMPRLLRFALVLGAFLASAGGSAWAVRADRPIAANTLLAVTALIYAAAIGLTGQIFDIAGDPRLALRAAAMAAGLLALAGRSSGAAATALILVCLGEAAAVGERGIGWAAPAGALGVVLAWLWRSRLLAHAAGIALLIGGFVVGPERTTELFVFVAAAFAALAFWARTGIAPGHPAAQALYGWAAGGLLLFFAVAGFGDGVLEGLPHRALWLALSVAVLAVGRHDRHVGVTGVAVVSLAAAIFAILADLGLGLMTAAAVFAACAVAALAAGALLRWRARP